MCNLKIDLWKTDRLPTRTEQFVGVIAAVVSSICLFLISIFALVSDHFFVAAIFVAAALFTGRIAYRATFKNPKMPSPQAVKLVNYSFIFGGVCLLLSALFASELSTMLYSISIGLTGIWVGFYNLGEKVG